MWWNSPNLLIDLRSWWHSNFKTWTNFVEKMKWIEKPHEFVSLWTLIFYSAAVLRNYTTMINSDHIHLLREIPFFWPLMWQSHTHTYASRKNYYWEFNENFTFHRIKHFNLSIIELKIFVVIPKKKTKQFQ